MLMSADNPVICIVRAVVLVAKGLLPTVPLWLICVPKGLSGSDSVKVGYLLLLFVIYCRGGCCCKCGHNGGWFGCCGSNGQCQCGCGWNRERLAGGLSLFVQLFRG